MGASTPETELGRENKTISIQQRARVGETSLTGARQLHMLIPVVIARRSRRYPMSFISYFEGAGGSVIERCQLISAREADAWAEKAVMTHAPEGDDLRQVPRSFRRAN